MKLLLFFFLFSFLSQSKKYAFPILSPQSNSLQEAVYKGDIKKVKDLIKKGIDVNGKEESGKIPPLYWVSSDNIDIAKLLIKNGTDVNYIIKKDSILIGFEKRLVRLGFWFYTTAFFYKKRL